ncbi:MAG: phosphoenolpyruvate--protein phosphotransferase [Rhizobiales bacterium]|nr:phosphoenolpyruvate--protein phosphotransferase [Hyphomicrobiales bacterium]
MVHVDAVPRLLIRRLRQIMAEPGSAQEQLDRIVGQIASLMVAEVCSVYVRRQDGSLELFATQGLKREAVHNTHMKRGEGLVGLIAEQAKAINLSEAQSHPSFSYRPETGEEEFHSFLGVPVLRGGRVLGVLTVQNKTRRQYTEDEEDALQTTAMVLAEVLAGTVERIDPSLPDGAPGRSRVLQGEQLSDGLALGHIVLHEPRVIVTQLVSDDPEAERVRLDEAIVDLRTGLDRIFANRDIAAAGEHHEVLETYRMYADDQGWRRRLHEAIAAGLTAAGAVERVRNEMRARMLRNADPYWRERFRDLDDLSDRLLRTLAGVPATGAHQVLPPDAILVARTLGPAELLDYDRERLRGLVIEDSGATSHVAIVAKALGIAAVGQARGIVEAVEPGDPAIVDATAGEIHIRPGQEVIGAFSDKVRFRARRLQKYSSLRGAPAVTRDGVRVALNINAGLMVDLPHLEESGADGIGLFRTELEFMISSSILGRDRQTEIYRAILETAGERPVVFRTLDIGGDKMLPYLRHEREENPALGWRAIRMSLDRTGLFRTQIRALLRAAAGRELRVMLPMLTDVAEFDEARRLIDLEIGLLSRFSSPPPRGIEIGAMVEVPALLFQLDEIARRADFLSIGSNDLFQFTFAVDRANERVARRYDTLSPAMLSVIRAIVAAAERHETPLTLCGEMAGRPLEAMVLIALGLRSISMAPASIGPVKAMLLGLDAAVLRTYLDRALAQGRRDVRAVAAEFASAHGIEI